MLRFTTLIAALVAAITFPQYGFTQATGPQAMAQSLLLTHSINERVELLIAHRPTPPGLEPTVPETTEIDYALRLMGAPGSDGARTKVSTDSFGRFVIKADRIGDEGCLIVNDEHELGCVSVYGDDRIAYEVEVGSAITDFPYLGDIPILGRQSSVTVALVDAEGRSAGLVEVSVFNRFVFSGDVYQDGP